MKKLTTVIVGIFALLPVFLNAQLPASQATVEADARKTVNAKIFNTIQGEPGFAPRISAGYKQRNENGLVIEFECSQLEKGYNSGPAFAPRANHAYFLQSVSRQTPVPKSSYIRWFTTSLTTLSIRESRGFVKSANVWVAEAEAAFQDNSSLKISVERRNDILTDEFTLKETTFHPAKYQLITTIIQIKRPVSKGINGILELNTGSYYGYSRFGNRLGLQLCPASGIEANVDLEYVQLSGEQNVSGYLVRGNAGYDWSRNISTGMTLVTNTFYGFTAILTSFTYRKGAHTLKAEYRNLLDKSMNPIETENIFFASNILFQYSLTIRTL